MGLVRERIGPHTNASMQRISSKPVATINKSVKKPEHAWDLYGHTKHKVTVEIKLRPLYRCGPFPGRK